MFLLPDPDMNARVYDETGNTPLRLLTTNGGSRGYPGAPARCGGQCPE
jgi:hypothetical protein